MAALWMLLSGLVLVVAGFLVSRTEPISGLDAATIETSPAPTDPSEEPVPPKPASGATSSPVPPEAVTFVRVDVRMPVLPVGVLASGALQLPEQPDTLGWWAAGAVPGAAEGTVVLAGHVDSAQFGVGPLARVLADGVGGHIDIVDSVGATHRYAVASRRSYPQGALPPDLFSSAGPPRVAVFTCGGPFDRRSGRYRDNIVLLAYPLSAT